MRRPWRRQSVGVVDWRRRRGVAAASGGAGGGGAAEGASCAGGGGGWGGVLEFDGGDGVDAAGGEGAEGFGGEREVALEFGEEVEREGLGGEEVAEEVGAFVAFALGG